MGRHRQRIDPIANNAAEAGRAAGLREVVFADGRRLRIRPVAASDRDGLEAFDGGLSEVDRRLRYFSVYRPNRAFFDRLTRIEERGGCSLVAETLDLKGEARIVAEADYERLASGDGELGITVEQAWRGWLGPFLLDALCEVAAQRGVRHLVADMLCENHVMLALARGRGGVVVDHPELGVVRLRLPTI